MSVNNRSVQINVRLSVDERAHLAEAAERDGLDLSAWARMTMLRASRVRYYQIGVWSKNRAEWHSWTDAPDYTSRAAAEADLACADAEMRVDAEVREMPEWWRP